MKNNTVSRLGATCAIVLGVSYIMVGIFHTLSPMAHRISAGPELFLPAIASGFSFSTLVTWSFAIGSVVAFAAIPAIADRFRSLDEAWVRWTSHLALLGYAVAAITEFTILARFPRLAAAYVAGDAATRAAIAAEPLLVLDPHGWLTFGAVGAFIFTVSLLAWRQRAIPATLGYVGMAAGLLFGVALVGFILENEFLISIAAGLGGVVLVPIFYIWMGLILWREAGEAETGAARVATRGVTQS